MCLPVPAPSGRYEAFLITPRRTEEAPAFHTVLQRCPPIVSACLQYTLLSRKPHAALTPFSRSLSRRRLCAGKAGLPCHGSSPLRKYLFSAISSMALSGRKKPCPCRRRSCQSAAPQQYPSCRPTSRFFPIIPPDFSTESNSVVPPETCMARNFPSCGSQPIMAATDMSMLMGQFNHPHACHRTDCPSIAFRYSKNRHVRALPAVWELRSRLLHENFLFHGASREANFSHAEIPFPTASGLCRFPLL